MLPLRTFIVDPRSRSRAFGILATLLVIWSSAALSTAGAARDNVLRFAGPAQGPETLDPAQTRDLSAAGILRNIYRGLVYYDDDLNPVPELAESYEVSADGLTYAFRLRAEAIFQDGSPITPDDVAYSLARAVDPGTVEGDMSQLAGPAFLSDIAGFGDVNSGTVDSLSGIQVIDDHTLTITLSAPRSTFLMKLAAVPAAIVDRNQVESDSTWWAKPNGSGPYRVEEWKPGEHLELRRFDGFVLGKPHIRTIEIRLGSRAVQSFNLYQADEVDLDSVTIYDLDRVTDPNGEYADQLVRTPQFGFGFVALRTDMAPLDDPKIREALQLTFPRDQLAGITFNGQVDSAHGVIPNGMLGREWPDVIEPANIEAARTAIAESSYGSAADVPPIRIYGSGPLASEVLRSVAEEHLGLTVDVFDMEWFDFLDRLDSGSLPAFELYWAADYPDPEAILLALWGTGQPDNYTGYANPDVDELLAQAAAESDPEFRAALYQDAERLILDDNVVIPAYIDVQYIVVKPWVLNLVVTPIGILRLETVRIDR